MSTHNICFAAEIRKYQYFSAWKKCLIWSCVALPCPMIKIFLAVTDLVDTVKYVYMSWIFMA